MGLLWGIKGGIGNIFISLFAIFLLSQKEKIPDTLFPGIFIGISIYFIIFLLVLALKKTLNELEESEGKYKNLVEKASDGIVIIQDGIIKYVNQIVAPILGFSAEEIIGTKFTKYIHKKDLQRVVGFYNKRMKGKKAPSVYEATLKNKKGGHVFAEFNAETINFQGKVADVIIIRDITHRKQVEGILHQREQEFQILVETAPDIIARFDQEYRFVYANPAIEEEWNISRKDFFWKKIDDVNLSQEFLQLWKNAINQVFEGKKKKSIYSEYGSGNKLKYYYTRFFPEMDKDGNVRTVLSISRDITEVQEIDKVRSEFISISSHQLRTPLSIIRWCAIAMLSEESGKLNKEQKEYINRIYLSSKQLIKLANAFLNVAIVDLGILNINPQFSNIENALKETLKEFEKEITRKKITAIEKFEKKLPEIQIGPRLLKIVLRALISNAVNYSNESSKIIIETKIKDNNALVKISDEGCGIPKDEQWRIFTKFFRGKNAKNMESYGVGLDLYIAKSIIKNAEGEIWFESPNLESSDKKSGSIFYFTIPLKEKKKESRE